MTLEYGEWTDADLRVITILSDLAWDCYSVATDHGFHGPGQDNPLAKLMLIVSEVGEICEAVRQPDSPQSSKIDFSLEEEEAADVLIRLLDYCKMRGLRIGHATVAKQAYNRQRPFMHGKTA